MRQFKVPGRAASPSSGSARLNKREKRKILGLLIGLVFVAYVISESGKTTNEYLDSQSDGLPQTELTFEETVLLPKIDAQRIDSLVREDRQIDRVVLESEPLDLLLNEARALTDRHFEAMQAAELNAESVARILETPSAHRAKPFFARGRVDALRTRRRGPEHPTEYIGRLLLDDGTPVYFIVLEVPEDALYLRVDGLFLKNYSDELYEEPGEWVDGPLLVGPRALSSFASFGTVEGYEWMALYDLRDAKLNVDLPQVVRETPFAPLWHAMAFARDLPPDAIDWDLAPVLTTELLDELNEDPQKWRFQPMRIPISRIQDVRVKRTGENPARIERYTQGWIGNPTWNNVIHFRSPAVNTELSLGDYAVARGFFLHNFAYDPKSFDLRSAPFFVLYSIDKFYPKENPWLVMLAYTVAGGSVLLTGLLIFILFRDKRKAKALHEELIRRRRARRARQGGSRPGNGSIGAATP
jgi:hypothetical protein